MKTSFTEKELKKKLYRITKSEIEEIRELALSDNGFMNLLIKISLSNEPRSNWRAAWVIYHITTENREKIIPFIPEIVKKMPAFKYHSQVGCYMRLLLELDIDFNEMGVLVDFCIEQLKKEKNPPYIKHYSIKMLVQICEQIPELKREIVLIIKEELTRFTPGHHVTAAKWALVRLEK